MTTIPSPSDIRRLAGELAKPRQDIETAFVDAGARLSEGAATLNKLTKLFDTLPQALQGETVSAAGDHLRAVATKAGELSDAFTQEKADLARLVEVVAAASAPISDLRRTVKMMGIVSVNARVTAAGIVGDSDDFDVFTTDIATLSDSASQTIQQFAQVYRQLTTEVDRAAQQRARFEASHAHTLSGLAGSLTDTIAALDAQRDQAAAGSAETGRVSRQIVGRIGGAVMALQVGDSTRQRIEHIEAGLDALADILDGKSTFDTQLPADEHADALAAISALEQAQLADTSSSFAGEMADAEQSLAALAADAEIIMGRSKDLYGSGSGKSSTMSALGAQLRKAVDILRDFEAERAKLETVARAVQDTVQTLLGHVNAVQEIEANMRLVSLNAAVRCAQLGPRGASLTVIASQLRELTSETVVAAEAAMSRLDESSALAGAFGASAIGDGAGQVGQLEQRANLALDLLSQLDKQMVAALNLLNSDGPKVIAQLQGAANALAGQGALSETMDDVRLQIAALTDAPLPENRSEALETIMNGLRRLYTMEAARAAHAQLFGAANTPEPAAEPAAEDEFSDFML
ncbi:hypothetical protein DEVEQU_02687 [Devosia equisanguinis]|uniref:Methyl-accepting chemotaxis protein n=1 Tax=Devosia equisanguinis TaxID=2490941 RepID=A0A3S4CDE0_9HYPH|nr:hypothetical protein [Devosia equisanguinis]VDS05545.1 hypothetical protein DEVEQU_02687 [Devosia equisanguinis]